MIDSFPPRDPAHVQDERRLRGNAEPSAKIAAPVGGHVVGVGEAVAADMCLRRRDAAGDHRIPLAVGRHDNCSCAASDPAVQRPVEQSFQQHLAEPRLEHAERFEDVRHVREAAPGCDPGRDRIAEAEDVRDVRPVEPGEGERESGRDPHPPVTQRSREVAHAGAVDDPERRPERGPGVEVGDRRGDDVDVVPARHEPPDQLARRHHRPAEGPRRRPDRRGEEDAKRPLVHRCEVSAPALWMELASHVTDW